MTLSVVLPAHDEQHAIPELVSRLTTVLQTLDRPWEIVLVDDGSTDATWARIRDAATADERVRGVRLARNFGHQAALSAGLALAEGDLVVTMDADLQHPPEAIPALVARMEEGYDVVYAIRRTRDGEPWLKARASPLFYRVLNRLARLDLPEGAADFRIMSRRVVDALVAMPERHRFLRGMTRWLGYPQSTVVYDAAEREGGRSKYGVLAMLRFALDALVSFSAVPLRIASVLGFAASLVGGVYLIYVLAVRAFSDAVVPGWTSVVVAVLILGGAQLICLGIIGQYLGRMYDEQKGRPLFLIGEDTRGAAPPVHHGRAEGRGARLMVDRLLDRVDPLRGLVPSRDLPFVDAAAVVVALFVAYAARAATNATYPLDWSGVAPYARAALPVSLAALLLAAASLGLYGPRAIAGTLREHLAAVAYATAVVAVVGTYYGGQFPPTLVLLPGSVALLAALHAGRRLYRRATRRAALARA